MHFTLVDRILSLTDESAVTLKNVSLAEEYLQDHFATFPVLPGVLMIESLVQAARLVMERRAESAAGLATEPIGEHVPRYPNQRWVLGKARALKYGAFVRPGAALRIEVNLAKVNDDGSVDFKAQALLIEPQSTVPPPVAAAGRITLRPVRSAVFV